MDNRETRPVRAQADRGTRSTGASAASVAIASCTRWSSPSAGLRALIMALNDIGVSVSTLPWQCDQDFSRFDLVLPLATWDYAEDPAGFRAWMTDIASRGGRFANAPEMMAWNMDKRYLTDLARRGVRVPESVMVETVDQARRHMHQRGWSQAVIKPTIGQSGNDVRLIDAHTPIPPLRSRQLLQAWMPRIQQGELSMVFVNGQYSHAALRLPAEDDWRANSQYGVRVSPVDASEPARAAARACLDTLPQMPFYARVDGLILSDGFVLTELELIEPALFFDIVEGSAAHFARAVIHRL